MSHEAWNLRNSDLNVWRLSHLCFLRLLFCLVESKKSLLVNKTVGIKIQKRKVHSHEVVAYHFRFEYFRLYNLFVCQCGVNFVSVFLAVMLMTSAQQAPDCVSIARQAPKDISNYYYPHERNCNKYYQCAEYGLVEMHCPAGLHFDRNYYVCGWPHEVSC